MVIDKIEEKLKYRKELVDKYTKVLREKNIWTFNPGHTEWLPAKKEEIKKAILQNYYLLKEEEISEKDKMSHLGAYTELASFIDNKDDVEYARKRFKEIENENYSNLQESIDKEKLDQLNDAKYESTYLDISDGKADLSSEFLSKTDTQKKNEQNNELWSLEILDDKLKEKLGRNAMFFHIIFGTIFFLISGFSIVSLSFAGFIVLGIWLTILSAVIFYGVIKLASRKIKIIKLYHQISFLIFEAVYYFLVVLILFKTYISLIGIN